MRALGGGQCVVTFALHQLELAHVCPGELVDDAVHLGAGTSLHVAHHAGHVELELVLRHSNNTTSTSTRQRVISQPAGKVQW
jgi:hypothetical protein